MPSAQFANKATEQRIKSTAAELRDIYQNALRDLRDKANDFERGHKRRVRRYQRMLKNGEITKDDYIAWMRGQVFQRQQWQAKQAQMAQAMVDADKHAMAIICDGKIGIFADNANWIGWQLERGQGIDMGFALYNENSVRRIARDHPNMLPLPQVDDGRDFTWYNDIMTRAITQGILQGEDLAEIMDRVIWDTGNNADTAMMRNVRTAYVSAQNAGRLEGMYQAEALGVKPKKRWCCSFLKGSREAHAQLDGQTREPDEPFQSILGPIMFPGDPDAHPSNVYNCHCWLEEVFEDDPQQGARLRQDGETGQIMPALTYDEWKAMKGAGH